TPARDAWPQVAHDLAATRAVPTPPAATAAVRWRVPLLGGMTAPPAVVGGRVVAASLGGEVAVFDLADGRERWRRRFDPAVHGSGDGAVSLGFFGGPAVQGDRILVASDRVRCLRLHDGAVVWEADPLRPPDGDDYFWGAPVVAAGLVIAGSGAGSESTATRGRVSAYRLADGALRWSTPMVPEGGNGGGVLGPVSVDRARGAVLAGTGAPYVAVPGADPGTCSLVELALADGRVRWSDQLHPADELGLDVNSAPVLTRRTIAVTAKDGVWAWDRASRTRLWRRPLTPATPAEGGTAGPVNGPEGGPIATDGRSFYVLSNDGDAGHSVAAALDARTGAVRWRTDLGGLTFAAPALAGDVLCATTASGDLEVLAARDGRSIARIPLGGPSAGAVAAAHGRVVFGVGAEPFLPGGELLCVA
ncbi:MAG TPA: PQQ-binding-like beta-propeller repeat protein, partial [Miltoncostaea sp.]|nr:PQQ-binding-like beta-propeller repeat protein [Miltoncostaea sp.]